MPSPDYFTLGRNAEREGRFRIDGDGQPYSAQRNLLYPSFIAVVLRATGETGTASLLRAQVGLVCLAVLVVFLLAWRAHSPAAGLIAAAACAFDPTLPSAVSAVGVESFFLLTLLGVAAAWPSPALSALAVGLSLACRSVLFLMPALFWARQRAAWLFLAAYVLLIPWAARNAILFDRFIPFERAGAGDVLYAASLGHVWYPDDGAAIYRAADRQEPGWSHGSRGDSFARLGAMARANIRRAPGAYIVSCLERLWVSFLEFWPLLLPALAGFWFLRKDPYQNFLAALVSYYIAVHVPFALVPRFFTPIRPVLAIWAACGAAELLRRAFKSAPALLHTPGPALLVRWAAALVLAPLSALYLYGVTVLGTEMRDLSAWTASADRAGRDAMGAAEDAWNERIAAEPANPIWPLERGRVRERQGDLKGAAADYAVAGGRRPQDHEPLLALGSVALEEGRAGDALRAASLLVAEARRGKLTAPDAFANALELRAEAQLELGLRGWEADVDELLGMAPRVRFDGTLERAWRAGSPQAEAAWMAGHSPFREDQEPAARRKALKKWFRDLALAESALRKAEQARRAGKTALARRALDAGWARFPGHLCGAALEHRGLDRVSPFVLESCSKRLTGRAKLLSDLGVALALQGDVGAARREFAAALKVDPGLAEAHLSLAALANKPAEAGEHLRLALEDARRRGRLDLAEAASIGLKNVTGGQP